MTQETAQALSDPLQYWIDYAKRSGLLSEGGVAPKPAQAQTAYNAYTAAWNQCAALAAAAPAAVGEAHALHARIINLPCNPVTLAGLASNVERAVYACGHRDARHAAAELVSAALSAAPSAPAVEAPTQAAPDLIELAKELGGRGGGERDPLATPYRAVALHQEQSGVSSRAQQPRRGEDDMTDQTTTAPAAPEASLSKINELAKVYASSYASPHHITFTVDGLRSFLQDAAAPAPSPAAQIADEREAFEAWARGPAGYVDDQLARYADGGYQDSTTRLHRSIFAAGWQARAALAAVPQAAPSAAPSNELFGNSEEHLIAAPAATVQPTGMKQVGEGFFTPGGVLRNSSKTIGYLGVRPEDAAAGCYIAPIYAADAAATVQPAASMDSLERLEELALECGTTQEWWDATALEVVLSEIRPQDAAFIAACSPTTILGLVRVAYASSPQGQDAQDALLLQVIDVLEESRDRVLRSMNGVQHALATIRAYSASSDRAQGDPHG